ncbi:MAG: TIR domain-containing protein [Desulfobaccales bacterium]
MEPIRVKVVQLGKLQTDEVNNMLGVANLCQPTYYFDEVQDLKADLSPYRLPNKSYDLDTATEQHVLPKYYERPLIVLTSEPYGAPARGSEEEAFYLLGALETNVSIISTYLWKDFKSAWSLQLYLLFMIGTSLISEYAGLQFHDETRGCLFDFCEEPIDIYRSLKSDNFFCPTCNTYIERALREGRINLDQLVSAMRIINRARRIELSCFISYSHKDEAFAKKLYLRMKKRKLKVWLAAEDLGDGIIHDQLERSIRLHDKLLLVLSNNSMSSEWVKTEIRWAMDEAIKENVNKLLPIRLVEMDSVNEWKLFDSDIGKDLAREIRQYLIHDFSNWQDLKAFNRAFRRLIGYI